MKPTAKRQTRSRERSQLARELDALVRDDGIHTTAIPGVRLARRSHAEGKHPAIYEPTIVFLGQGRKRIYLGGKVIQYDADNYLALSVPVPVECEVQASPDEPLLALSITVEPATLAEILVNLDEPARTEGAVPRGIYASPLTDELNDAALRLLRSLRSPTDSRILGPQTVREIVYRVLMGEQGGALRALATRNEQFMRIARVLQQIHADYSRPLSTDELAKVAGMSVSTFHHNFKAVTATSPLQYLKSIRLHQARLLMVHAGHNASTAAAAVGYESASQFGREFKRMFGASPAEDASVMRTRVPFTPLESPARRQRVIETV